MKLWI